MRSHVNFPLHFRLLKSARSPHQAAQGRLYIQEASPSIFLQVVIDLRVKPLPISHPMNSAMLQTASLQSSIPRVLSSGGGRGAGAGGGFCSSPGSPRMSFSPGSPRMSFSMDQCRGRSHGIRRVMSENEVVAAGCGIGGGVPRSFSSANIQDDKEDQLPIDRERTVDGVWSDMMGFRGGGCGDGFNNGGKLGKYYEKMLRMNPGNPLLLRNYARYLHEVEGNTDRAEEYYGRAILADPGEGEVLSMYAKLIWEVQGDGERAKSYHDQAVSASPDNCMVLGSLAQFLWESDKGDEEEREKRGEGDNMAFEVAAF